MSEGKKYHPKEATEKGGPTRRGFLQLMGIAAVELALPKLARGQRRENTGSESVEKTLGEKIEDAKEKLRVLNEKIKKAVESLAPKQKDELFPYAALPEAQMQERKLKFLSQFGGYISEFGQVITAFVSANSKQITAERARLVFDGYVMFAFQDLERVLCHGILERELAGCGIQFDFSVWPGHYSVPAVDFLPQGKNLTPEEIDPFLNPRLKFYLREKDLKRYQGLSFWTQENAFAVVRELIDQPTVRASISADKSLMLAGAFSILKAVARRIVTPGEKLKAEEIIAAIMQEREKFKKRVVVGKDTTVLGFFGKDINPATKKNNFTTENLTNLQAACGGVKFSSLREANKDKKAHEKFLKDISDSHGSVFIFVETHGLPTQWTTSLDTDDKTPKITPTDLAKALLERIYAEYKNGGEESARLALKDVTIFSGACLSYDFLFKNLLPALKKEAGKKTAKGLPPLDFDKLYLPQIITAAQEGSVAFSIFGEVMEKRKEIFKGPMTGEDFFAIEPLMALSNDLTVSSSAPGELFQIGALKKQAGDAGV